MAKRRSGAGKTIEKVVIPHERSPDFRTIFADGVLIRAHDDTLIMTFFSNDVRVVSQDAEVDKKAGRIRFLADLREERGRVQEGAVRMKTKEALDLALAIIDRLATEAPELVKQRVEVKKGRETA